MLLSISFLFELLNYNLAPYFLFPFSLFFFFFFLSISLHFFFFHNHFHFSALHSPIFLFFSQSLRSSFFQFHHFGNKTFSTNYRTKSICRINRKDCSRNSSVSLTPKAHKKDMFHGREWPTVKIKVILPSTLEVEVVVEGPNLGRLYEVGSFLFPFPPPPLVFFFPHSFFPLCFFLSIQAVRKVTRSSSTPQPPLFSNALFHAPETLLWVVYRRKMGGGNSCYSILSDFDVESLCGIDVVVPTISSEQSLFIPLLFLLSFSSFFPNLPLFLSPPSFYLPPKATFPTQPLHVAPPPLRSILTRGKCLPDPICGYVLFFLFFSFFSFSFSFFFSFLFSSLSFSFSLFQSFPHKQKIQTKKETT